MKDRLKDFLVSGHKFSKFELDTQNRYQIVNIGLILSAIGMIYGITGNIIRDVKGFVLVESILLVMIISLIFLLRKYRGIFEYVTIIMTAQFMFLFLLLVYIGNPDDLKHIWIIVFPAILLYFQTSKQIMFWMSLMTFLLLMAPFQPFIEIKYSVYQITYLTFVMLILSAMIHFYQTKMDEAQKLILEQQKQLLAFNSDLEIQVEDKTAKLRELNESLEIKVQEKIDELIHKDKLLTAQSKQAVMGEMISMIAHQWRQPLSTITLQISNLQLKRLMGNNVDGEQTDKTLSDISDTIIYLSETIDDFQTYFHPEKIIAEIEVHELLQRAVTFAIPRVEAHSIEINIEDEDSILIQTYINELIQVVLNILNNAIDAFIEANVDSGEIKVSVEKKKEKIYIHVLDNATGISEENIDKVFEPYFSTKGKNGTGLGLYMSQMIVEKQFGGNISVKNSNNGAMFTVEIPQKIS